MKQLYLIVFSLFLLSCGDDESPVMMEEPTEDIIEEYSLSTEQCTDLFQPAGTAFHNLTKNEVSFAEPAFGLVLFDPNPPLLVVPLNDDGTFGPASFEDYTTLLVAVSNDTIFIQTDILGLNSFQSCKSHYVKL